MAKFTDNQIATNRKEAPVVPVVKKAPTPAQNQSNQSNANKGTKGTNRQYDQAQGNRGKQMNPNLEEKKTPTHENVSTNQKLATVIPEAKKQIKPQQPKQQHQSRNNGI
jgi:hypothetical protein